MKLPDVQITAGFYIGAAMAALLLPWDVLSAFAGASGFHELCHLLALRCCKVPVQQIKLGTFGAKIETAAMVPVQELICTAAGPAGSLALLLIARQMPLLALFGLCQGAFNLLPFFPLDGGRMVHAIISACKDASLRVQ